MTVVGVLTAGLLLGCPKPPEPAAPTPGPTVTKAPPRSTADDDLLTSSPTRGGTPITSMAPLGPTTSQPAAGTRKYVAKQGDTLIKIARTELGNEHRLAEIKTLNPGLEPSNWKVNIGQEILIPAK